jgi:hypothetical protein
VGGNHGIHYRCEFIRVAPGAIYRLSLDARNTCGGEPMVFVKGFFDRPRMNDTFEPRAPSAHTDTHSMRRTEFLNSPYRVHLCAAKPPVVKDMMTESGEQVLKREIYRVERTLHGSDGEWRRFATVFHPALSKSTVEGKPKQPEWLRVELYAYWPVGVYEFDNVRLEIVGHEEIQPPPAPAKEPEKPAKPLKDDEFPVFGK